MQGGQMEEMQMFQSSVNELMIRSCFQDDGKLHVRTTMRLGDQPPEHTHTTYSMCLDDELETLMLAILWEHFQRARRFSAGLDYVLET
jgi:hypothetical protein